MMTEQERDAERERDTEAEQTAEPGDNLRPTPTAAAFSLPDAEMRGGIPRFSDEDVSKMLESGQGRAALARLAIIQAMRDPTALDDLMRAAYRTGDHIRIAEARRVRKMIRQKIRKQTGAARHGRQSQ